MNGLHSTLQIIFICIGCFLTFLGIYVRALQLLTLQIQEKAEDSEVVPQMFLRKMRTKKKKASKENDCKVNEGREKRCWQLSRKCIDAAAENETTTDMDK